jgi:histidinol-phosphate phosphatase family protein
VPGAIRRLNEAGFRTVIITNQSGIGRGMFDEATLARIHDKMVGQIEAGGGRIDAIYFCPHAPDEGCSCRKPEIGMGLRAVKDMGIDPGKSFMIGDKEKDMEFGRRLGCRGTLMVDYPERTFSDAVDELLRQCRSRTASAPRALR